MKQMAMWGSGIVLAALFIWGASWLAKHGSYAIWYEDMVKETVREMVIQKALIKQEADK
jgi:hypothetical protein